MVASFAEAWIEIVDGETEMDGITVASFAEAWIEIINPFMIDTTPCTCRLLRGGVD